MKLKKDNALFIGLGLVSLITIPTVFGVLSSCSATKSTSDNDNKPGLDDSIDDDMQQNWEQWLESELKLHVQALFDETISDLDNLKNPEKIKYFNLNKVESKTPTWHFDVGDTVKIPANFTSLKSNKNKESNYKYYWFIDYPAAKPARNKRDVNKEAEITNKSVFLRATNTLEVEFYDLANYDDNAVITCVQIDTNSPFEQFKENNFENIDAYYWQTTLLLGKPFTISNPNIKLNNGAEESIDSDSRITYLTTYGTTFEISANCEVNDKYRKYLKYQWFKKISQVVVNLQKSMMLQIKYWKVQLIVMIPESINV